MQNITGSWNADDFADVGTGAIYRTMGSSHSQKQGVGTAYQKYVFDASRVARTGEETRSVNFTYILWKRIN